MSDIIHTRTNAAGDEVTFTDEQMQLVHVWMTGARPEGAGDELRLAIANAAESYFFTHGVNNESLTILVGMIHKAHSSAQEIEAGDIGEAE